VYLNVKGDKITEYFKTLMFQYGDYFDDVWGTADDEDGFDVSIVSSSEPDVLRTLDDTVAYLDIKVFDKILTDDDLDIKVFDKILTDDDLERVKVCKNNRVELCDVDTPVPEWQPFDWDSLFT